METKPTHEPAQLHLQVYDLRGEARLRRPLSLSVSRLDSTLNQTKTSKTCYNR